MDKAQEPENNESKESSEEKAYRISYRDALADAGIAEDDFNTLSDSIVPACCSEGCEVEPDGKCSHGFPSVLIAMGVI